MNVMNSTSVKSEMVLSWLLYPVVFNVVFRRVHTQVVQIIKSAPLATWITWCNSKDVHSPALSSLRTFGDKPLRIRSTFPGMNCSESSGVFATATQNASLNLSKSENSRPRSLSAICVGIGEPSAVPAPASQIPVTSSPCPVTVPELSRAGRENTKYNELSPESAGKTRMQSSVSMSSPPDSPRSESLFLARSGVRAGCLGCCWRQGGPSPECLIVL